MSAEARPSGDLPGHLRPRHVGHLDIIRRAASVFDRVVVAVVREPAQGAAVLGRGPRRFLITPSRADKVEVDEFSGPRRRLRPAAGAPTRW